jgi:hypothetical protein
MKKVIVAAAVFIIGGIQGCSRDPASEGDVRIALYTQCVNGPTYAGNVDLGHIKGYQCNRASIDEFLAGLYGHSFIPPVDPTPYEEEILKYKRN